MNEYEVAYALSIGDKFDDREWPWTKVKCLFRNFQRLLSTLNCVSALGINPLKPNSSNYYILIYRPHPWAPECPNVRN